MHFLKKIINNPKLEDLANKHMDVHRHFYRYSRGEFTGPAIKLQQTSTKFALKGSLEYEDLVQELVLKSISVEEVEIEGILITGKDISERLRELNLEWDFKESTGKTKNFKAKFIETLQIEKIINLIDEFREYGYFLLDFKLGKWVKVDTKKRLPRPSKKKPIDDDVSDRVQFCKGYTDHTEENNKMIIDEVLYDFKDEVPEDWSKITLRNNYKIDEIAIPRDIKDSRLLRILAIRKGKLIRTAKIDDEVVEKQYPFKV